ncbi:MAG: rRNA cytosine-C5-methyltransferase [Bacteroidales bacterium]|nr:rRNA cytosine-C5-methyltransferase [Bacteroidales bacterium]
MEDSVLQTFRDSIASVADADALVAALQTERLTSIRVNPLKISGFNLPKVPWCENGYYLTKRPLFTLNPLFHAGTFYVQEASSMFLEKIIKPLTEKPLRVLDLCAAPGGKTTLALSLLPKGSLLVANEVIKTRSQILSENLIKWGHSNCIVTNNDPKDFCFLKGYFDLVIVDAPCSGEGMFRKDSDAISEWSPENVDLCSKRQLRILYDIWDCLAPNGTLIYSTCTFNEKENEDVVSRFIAENNAVCERIELNPEWNITEREKNGAFSYRFFPHKTEGEGFSVSVIKKTDGNEYSTPKRIQQSKNFTILSEKNKQPYSHLLLTDNQLIFSDKRNFLWSFPQEYEKVLLEIASHCVIVHAGTPLVELLGNKVNPLPGLAFSTSYNSESFTSAEIDLETAVRYFKKEPLLLPNVEKGWVNITYKNVSVGFVKNIGNRANNPYPQEWAIKMNIDYNRLENSEFE